MVLGDFNGDGIPDVAMVSPNGIDVYIPSAS
jgi:hypothetical protein